LEVAAAKELGVRSEGKWGALSLHRVRSFCNGVAWQWRAIAASRPKFNPQDKEVKIETPQLHLL